MKYCRNLHKYINYIDIYISIMYTHVFLDNYAIIFNYSNISLEACGGMKSLKHASQAAESKAS